MATVPIVTEVTLAQLEALVAANGLNEGLQYKVTDKDWLLIATSENTLKAATGVLIVLQSDNLPNYITTDFLYVDTGVINALDGVWPDKTLNINSPLGYIPFCSEIDVISQDDLRSYYINGQRITNEDTDPSAFSCILTIPFLSSGAFGAAQLSCPNFVDGVDSFRLILGCFRTKLI